MPRRPRSADLETRTRRLQLPIKKKAQCPISIGNGVTLPDSASPGLERRPSASPRSDMVKWKQKVQLSLFTQQ
jgi:hypothetical protein